MASSVPSTSRSASPYTAATSSVHGGSAMIGAAQTPTSSSLHVTATNSAVNDGSDYATVMSDHLYKAFIHAEFTDLTLAVTYQDQELPAASFSVHSVIVARSPFLRSLIEQHRAYNGPAPLHIHAPPYCTHAALNIALLSLYTPAAFAHLTTDLGPGVLAAAGLLQLPELAEHAERACAVDVSRASTPEDFAKWFAILGFAKAPSPAAANGIATNGTSGNKASSKTTIDSAHARLRELLYDRLIVQLPTELGAFDSSTINNSASTNSSKGKQDERDAQQKLMHVFATLPFDVFKRVIESPRLPVLRAADLERFNFAKRVVAERKRIHVAQHHQQQQQQPGPRRTGDFDETVVLQFGTNTSSDGGGTAVSVLRKQKKREYWKVGASVHQQ